MHMNIHFNKTTFSNIVFTIVLALHTFNANGMLNSVLKKNNQLTSEPSNNNIIKKVFNEMIKRKMNKHYYIFLEGLSNYHPEQRYDENETVVHDSNKNAFLVFDENLGYDENLSYTDITDQIIEYLLILKSFLQVNKASYHKLKPVYDLRIKNLFEQFLFDKERYQNNQRINQYIGKKILGKDLLHTIKKTVILNIKNKNFCDNGRILFDLCVHGTTKWYIDNEEKIVVSTWGEGTCKDDLLQLITECNPFIMDFLKRITHTIPAGYTYFIGINSRDFDITPPICTAFKNAGMSIRKDEGYLLSTNPTNNHKALFKSLSIKSLTDK
ncbi:hypothetical protein EKK58_06830 [Candidatus Dependentiae bacterium]|nr:MAG: hypothetical protein EKK58_06830 [Candidatus Dependentiae bacterium]